MSGKILVLGATGNVGAPLVAELVAKGESVKAATRKGTNVAGAEPVSFDLNSSENIEGALDGVDRIFLMIPGGNLNVIAMTTPLISAAAKRKIKVVLQTNLGADGDDENPMRQIELKLINSGSPYVILRPNWFADNFHNYWGHGVKSGKISLPAEQGKSSFIDVRDIAASAAAALTNNAHNNKGYNLTGPAALSYAEAAAILSEVTGRNITYLPIDDATFTANLVGAGLAEDYANFLTMIFGPVRQGWTAVVTQDVKNLTGNAARSLAVYARDHAAALV